MDAALPELKLRTRHEILNRAGNEHLAGEGRRRDARPDVHGDPGHLLADDLALARMNAGSDLDAEAPHAVADRAGATDSLRRPLERRKEAIAGRVEHATIEAIQLLVNEVVVAFHELPPAAVADPRRVLARADDVREHHCREHAPVSPRFEVLLAHPVPADILNPLCRGH